MLAMTTAHLRTARGAIAAAFAVQGLVFISLTTRLPRFQDRWDLDELALSGVLLMMVLLAGVGSLVAERFAPRLDSATVLRAGLLVVAVSVTVAVLAPTTVVFVLGLAAYGVGLGLVDATGNMQAVALEHRWGRVVLPSCHGAWTLGGIVGAVATLLTGDLPWSAVALVAVFPLAAAAAPYLPRDHGVPATGTQIDVRRDGLPAAQPLWFGEQGERLVGRHREDGGLGDGHELLLNSWASATSWSSSLVQNLSISAWSLCKPDGTTR